MKSIRELGSLKGKTVIVRADCNVPMKGTKVIDAYRLEALVPTLKLLKKKNARIIVISHIGDDGVQSLAPIAKILSKHVPVSFVKDYKKAPAALVREGSIVMCENIRRYEGEMTNDSVFAKELASLAHLYVNDAFPVSHRKHASIVGIPKYLPSYAGLQMEKEVSHLSHVVEHPKRPFLFLLGGAKFETKMPLIKKFITKADYVFVGGALANDFLKTSGLEVGVSLVENTKNLRPLLSNKKLLLQTDAVVFDGKKSRVAQIEDVQKNESIVDIGPETTLLLSRMVQQAATVLWNGPFGKYKETYAKRGTQDVLKSLARNKKCMSVIGGGDIVAVVSGMKYQKKFTFVSTGGGATLAFLDKGTLPGIEALKKKNKQK